MSKAKKVHAEKGGARCGPTHGGAGIRHTISADTLRKHLAPAKIIHDSHFEPRNTDDKSVVAAAAAVDTAKAAMRMLRGPSRVMRAWLWFDGFSTSAAATAQAPVHRIRPSDSAEFSSFAALFDEYKVHNVKYRHRLAITVGVGSVGIDAAVAYDPLNSGAYGTLVAVLPAQINQQICSSASASQPIPRTASGLWELPFTLPRGASQDPTAVGPVATGTWVDTGVTAADFGYMKWFVNPASAAVTTTIFYWMGMEVEFRMRS